MKRLLTLLSCLLGSLFVDATETSPVTNAGFYERPEWKATELKVYEHWTLSVNTRQHTLGSVVIKARREGVQRMAELSQEEIAELALVMREYEGALARLQDFQPTSYAHYQLGNVLFQLHFHVMPRYDSDRLFDGQIWKDAPLDQDPLFTDSKESMERIAKLRELILTELK